MKRRPGITASVSYPAPPESPYVKVDIQYPVAALPAAAPDPTSALGDLQDVTGSDAVRYAAGAALVYHGYRRTGSILWALLYGLAGKQLPAVAVPVALAQGYGAKKPCSY